MNNCSLRTFRQLLIPVLIWSVCLNISAQDTDDAKAARKAERKARRAAERSASAKSPGALETRVKAGGAAADVAVNWENITLKDCIETLCRDLKMEFIISPSVNVAQEVSVRAGDITEWKRNNKLLLFDAILETAGVQRLQRGRVWVFSPSKLRPIVAAGDNNELNGGTAIIGVLKVKHITAAHAADILNTIDGKPSRIFPQNGSSTLLVSGTKDYLRQTEELLKLIDMPPAMLTHYMIKHADAGDLSNELNNLFYRRAGGDGSTIRFIPIARLNMVVVHNAPESMHEEIKHWIKILDSAEGANERVTRVYHIQVIDADTIAKTLNSLYSDLHKQALEKQKKYGAQKAQQPTTQATQKKTNNAKKKTAAKNSTKKSNGSSSSNGASPSIDYAEEEVIILADKDTNTLIVNAPL
ncbi:secretin N-terminal domain-containing protein, partial [Verrucomicrobiota bacterium]